MRKTSTFAIHLFEQAVTTRWILLSTALAAIGVIGIGVPIPPWVNILLAALSIALLGFEIYSYRREQSRITFSPKSIEDFTEVKARLANDKGSRIVMVHGQTFVHDLEVSRLIREADVMALVRPIPYTVPPELKTLGARYRRERIAKDSAIFNGPVLGWSSSLRPDDLRKGPVEMTKGTFFDRLATDYLAAVDAVRDGAEPILKGQQLFIDRNNNLRGFESSWLLNGIGVSTLAVTTDGKFVLTVQSLNNVGERGLLAPSGSGSLEPKDFGTSSTLSVAALAITGANRELEEEVSITSADIDSSHFLGFGRWLNKGASPELFSMTLLNVDSHNLRRRIRRPEERVYVDGHIFARPEIPIEAWDDTNPDAILPHDVRGRLSLPLGVVLSLLVREVQTPSSMLATQLSQRFSSGSS